MFAYVCVHVSACVCVSCNRVFSLQKRESANYNIKAVSTNDLSAFALCAITLNQERSGVDVALMHKLVTFTRAHSFFSRVSLFSLNAARRRLLNDSSNSAARIASGGRGTFIQVAAVDLVLVSPDVTQMLTKVVGLWSVTLSALICLLRSFTYL